MSLKHNINKIHGDLLTNFDKVNILEKSDYKQGNYFEVSIRENNKEVKAIIRKSDIESVSFNWKYYADPINEQSDLVERTSNIDNFYSDVKNIMQKNRFNESYVNLMEEVDNILVELKDEGFDIVIDADKFKKEVSSNFSILITKSFESEYTEFSTEKINDPIMSLIDYIRLTYKLSASYEYLESDIENNNYIKGEVTTNLPKVTTTILIIDFTKK